MAVKRNAAGLRGGVRDGEGHSENGIRAEPRFVGCAVELDQRLIDAFLVLDVEIAQPSSDLALDVADRFRHTLAGVARRVAIA